MRKERGFTLIELLISFAIFGIIMTVLITMLVRNQSAARVNELLIEAEQNTRVANDYISRHLRSTGFGRDLEGDQLSIVYADPFMVFINSDFDRDLPSPRDAYDPNQFPVLLPMYYDPDTMFGKAAETIIFGLDVDLDGDIDDDDMTSSALATSNPNDFMVVRRVFGSNGTDNGGDTTEIALIRGPWVDFGYDSDVVEPLFQFWLDMDEDGRVDKLWGDNNNNDSLEVSEYDFPAITMADSINLKPTLKYVRVISLNVTGETPGRDRGYRQNNGYRIVKMSSGIDVTRNEPPFFAKAQRREVFGEVYWVDALNNEIGFGDALISLTPHDASSETLGIARSLSKGDFHFFVPPDTYEVHLKIPEFHTLIAKIPDPAYAHVAESFTDEVKFEIEPDDTIGFIEGWVYIDRNGDRQWDTLTENKLAGVRLEIKTWDKDHDTLIPVQVYHTRTELNGHYLFTLPSDTTTNPISGHPYDTLRVITDLPWVATDTFWFDSLGYGDGDSLFGEIVTYIPMNQKSDTINFGLYDVRWDTINPVVEVTHIAGDTIPPCPAFEKTDTIMIQWNTIDLTPDSIFLEYSDDGVFWDTIAEVQDLGFFEWYVDVDPTTTGRFRVVAKDKNDNEGVDTTCIFEITPEGGLVPVFEFFFTDSVDFDTFRVLDPVPPVDAIPDSAWTETWITKENNPSVYLHDPDQGVVARWISPKDSVDSLPQGTWRFVRWGFSESFFDIIYVYWKVYKTDTLGENGTLLFSTKDSILGLLTKDPTVDTIKYETDSAFSFHPDTHRLLIEAWFNDRAPMDSANAAQNYYLYDALFDTMETDAAPSVRLKK
jgi:prepilin-type N-terminal cleavage/methylation domain-containing protein